MKILNRVRLNWSKWSLKAKQILSQSDDNEDNFTHDASNQQVHSITASPKKTAEKLSGQASEKQSKQLSNQHLSIAKESLTYLLDDKRIPKKVRDSLSDDYNLVEHMLEKLEHEHIHISVLGRVSVGKSSLLNVLMAKNCFSVSPLHGETKKPEFSGWNEYHAGNVFLIDTPGINEVDGQAREILTKEVVSRSDIILFVIDGDISDTEFQALKGVADGVQPIILVLNKMDQYSKAQQLLLLDKLKQRVENYIKADHIVACCSQKSIKHYIQLDEAGNETEFTKELDADVRQLKALLKSVLSKEGKTLAALNAVLFADKLSQQVTSRLMETQKNAADNIIRIYCVGKGVAVAVNPIPIADLMAAAIIDATMILHLSRVYGLPLTKAEAGKLVTTIMSQIIILMGSIWAMNLFSSALKLSSGGISTFVTASAQGAVAYYGTFIVGKAADYYFKHGKSWGKMGSKQAVKKILDSIDRDSIIQQAKKDIMQKMKTTP